MLLIQSQYPLDDLLDLAFGFLYFLFPCLYPFSPWIGLSQVSVEFMVLIRAAEELAAQFQFACFVLVD